MAVTYQLPRGSITVVGNNLVYRPYESSSSSSVSGGVVAGAVIGCLVAVVASILFGRWWYRRRESLSTTYSHINKNEISGVASVNHQKKTRGYGAL
jgi:hypothetical protein